MLSVQNLSSAAAAGTYYANIAEYYSHEVSSQLLWKGKEQLLGFSAIADKDQFEALLKGKLPSANNLDELERGKFNIGLDLT